METLESKDGIIYSITVENFFCHDKYRIDFNKNVNFIVGNNGSGKSAFVTALVIGFGGKASATNRGTNLSCFIKRGSASASVEIKLKNNGPAAYRHDVYGDSITVIRTLSRSGSSSYTTKSHTGTVVSSAFKEVQNIASHHYIQVDNPISVLNQDEARSFHNNDPEKIYAFFRKATNFDETEKNYEHARDLCKSAKTVQAIKSQAFSVMDEEYKKWETLLKQMESQEKIIQQKQELENEYFWSEVVELERAATAAAEERRLHEDKCAALDRKLHALSSAEQADSLQKARLELETVEARRRALQRQLEEAAAARRDAEAAARSSKHAAARLRADLARERRKCDDLRAGIAKEWESEGAGRARAEQEARVKAAERAAEAARARLATHTHSAAKARDHADAARDLLDEATNREREAKQTLARLEQKVRALEAHGGNARAAFGAKMVQLSERVAAAARARRFSREPRGPVGAYISLKDKQWGSALEHIIGSSLTTFCVNNDNDGRELYKIMKEVYGNDDKPSVTSSPFVERAHDVSRRAVRAPGHVTALDALRIDDPVIANFLIDNVSLETVLLVPDQDAAERLTSSAERVPRGLRRAVTAQCAEYFPAPNYRSYGGRARPVRFLHRDHADRVRQVQSELSAAAEAAEAARMERERCAEQLRAAADAQREEERALLALQADARAAAADLLAARDALRDHHAPTHAALEEELKACEQNVAVLEAKLRDAASGANGETGGDTDQTEERIAALKADLQRATTEYAELSNSAEQSRLAAERREGARAALAAQLAAARADLQRAAAAADHAAAKAANHAALTGELGPRLQNPRPKEEVARLVKEASAALARGSGTTLSRREVAERMLALRPRRDAIQRDLRRLAALILRIEATIEEHLQICYRVQTEIVRRVQLSFVHILEGRFFSGELKVDRVRQRLSVECRRRGDGGGGGGGGGGAAALSGGERSFATVAFFMALWNCVDLPFFFLDEFDVFMDNMNRKLVMDLLVEHALQEHPNRQFVFLTPQDGSTIQSNEYISIFRLQEPRG